MASLSAIHGLKIVRCRQLYVIQIGTVFINRITKLLKQEKWYLKCSAIKLFDELFI